MHDYDGAFGGLAAIAAFIFLVWIFTDHPAFSWFTGERNSYQVTCVSSDRSWKAPVSKRYLVVQCPKGAKHKTLVKKTYVVSFDKQFVVEQTDRLNWIRRLDNCIVFNAENWRCNLSSSDLSYVSMEDDKAEGSSETTMYVSKATWYWTKWTKE